MSKIHSAAKADFEKLGSDADFGIQHQRGTRLIQYTSHIRFRIVSIFSHTIAH